MRADQEKCAHVTYRPRVGAHGIEVGACSEVCMWPRTLCPAHHEHERELRLYADAYETTDVSAFGCSCYPLYQPSSTLVPSQLSVSIVRRWPGWNAVAIALPFLLVYVTLWL